MTITVKYFGALAEAAAKNEESIDISAIGNDLNDLREHCLNKYSTLGELSFKIAVNQSIQEEAELQDGDEVAFLPPFAGG